LEPTEDVVILPCAHILCRSCCFYLLETTCHSSITNEPSTEFVVENGNDHSVEIHENEIEEQNLTKGLHSNTDMNTNENQIHIFETKKSGKIIKRRPCPVCRLPFTKLEVCISLLFLYIFSHYLI
jgi:hypothetical protein